MTLAKGGQALAPIVVPANAPQANLDAARELAEYIGKISGATPEVIEGRPDPAPESAVWVGVPEGAEDIFPGEDLEFRRPEEILILCNGRHLLVAGRDRVIDERQTEYGTANAVYTFLQERLGVRWLWPGDLGEDIIPSDTIAFEPFDHRFHPPLRERRMRFPAARTAREVIDWWSVRQRGRGSLDSDHSHAFNAWWGLYGGEHPDWFALQPDGTREPRRGNRAKLCVSNPEVAAQWIENAEERLRADPQLMVVGASPTDGGGWCVCENCEGWDHPDAGEDDRGRRIMTDRYVRFWNILARGLRERFPEREALVDVMAYARYKSPPIGERLEENIAVAYVGHFPINSEAQRTREKAEWTEWARMASMIKYRPNLFWYSGGVWGLPTFEPRKTIEDFRFLGENRGVGIDVDSVHLNYATKGPQLYLMAQLSYDPLQDGHALLDDYWRRGFGPAAEEIAEYFGLMEAAHQRIVETPGFHTGGGARYRVAETFKQVYDPDFFERADAALRRAEAKAADGPERFRDRVAFVRSGLDFAALQIDILHAMDRVRETQGRDRDAVNKAVELSEARERLFEQAPPYALDRRRIMDQISRRGMTDHLGPPADKFLEAAEEEEAGPQAVRLAPADWRLVLRDDFGRDELGGDWEAVEGVWAIEDGALGTDSEGAVLLAAGSFPGLQRIVLEAEAPAREGMDGDAAARSVSDLSPVLHTSGENATRSGYFMQFGGSWNTANTLRRAGSPVQRNAEARIAPNHVHTIEAEFDGSHARLKVDGETVLEHEEPYPLVGAGHDRLGIYTWSGIRIHSARLYTSEAREAHPDLDDPDFD